MNILEILKQKNDLAKIALQYDELDLPGDLETPVSAFLKLRPLGAKFLLESAEDPTSIGRYTFIGIDPLLQIRIEDGRTMMTSGDDEMVITHNSSGEPFAGVQKLIETFALKSSRAEIPLLGGLVGFTSYEIVQCFEPKLAGLIPKSDHPLGLYYFVDTVLVFDHYMRRLKLLRLRHADGALGSGREHVTMEQIRDALSSQTVKSEHIKSANGNKYDSNFDQGAFEEVVVRAQKHIFKGDIFQAVLSQREEHVSEVDGFHVYRALRMLNPSPYMFYLQFDDVELIGSSPEAMVRLQGRQATIRPIAGTRRRGRTSEDDLRMANELLRDEKERSEHVMLVDLGRNDLGRVCKYGSVKVTSMMQMEYYSHVMHMTSNVVGHLRDDCSQFDLFRAAFPAGTVSGAPKLRAMEIIADLEKTSRGPYAGAVGYFSLSGELDMCITIRTIVKCGNRLHLQAGAGIVADSIPAQEYLETGNKIAALKEAIRVAEEGLL